MSYEQHLDEVTTLITEKYDIADQPAIDMVMRAQADGYFSGHDDHPAICTLDRAHEDARTVFKKYGKGKEYINCSSYGEKIEVAKDFEKGDLIHVFGYFKEREYNGKTYKNFVVKSYNKIEKKDNF